MSLLAKLASKIALDVNLLDFGLFAKWFVNDIVLNSFHRSTSFLSIWLVRAVLEQSPVFLQNWVRGCVVGYQFKPGKSLLTSMSFSVTLVKKWATFCLLNGPCVARKYHLCLHKVRLCADINCNVREQMEQVLQRLGYVIRHKSIFVLTWQCYFTVIQACYQCLLSMLPLKHPRPRCLLCSRCQVWYRPPQQEGVHRIWQGYWSPSGDTKEDWESC